MNIKAVMAKCLSLICRESEINEDGNSKDLIAEVMASLKTNGQDISGVVPMWNELKDLILRNAETAEMGVSKTSILQEVKLICANDVNLYESIQDDLMYDMDPDEAKSSVMRHRFELAKYLKNKRAMEILDKTAYDLKFKSDDIGAIDAYMTKRLNEMSELVSYSGEELPGIVVELDLSDEESVAEQYDLIRKESDGSRVLKTPWQRLNKMTRGGLRLGQLTVVGGLAHNNKTGVCLSLFISACVFNNPKDLLTDHTKKPLNVLFSFEDDMQIVLANIYTLLKGNFDNVQISDEEKAHLDKYATARYVREKLEEKGYNIKIVRVNPSEWSYIEIQNKILQYESEGYEVHMCLIDYLNLANKNGLPNIRGDSDVQELFRRTKNFMCAQHNIALVTPHQLSGDALELKRMGNKYLVKQVADGSYYADCRGLYREPELEILIDIVKDNSKKYQAFARGKHRGQNDTPEEDKFFILPFSKIGGLRWDINGRDSASSSFRHDVAEQGSEDFSPEDVAANG